MGTRGSLRSVLEKFSRKCELQRATLLDVSPEGLRAVMFDPLLLRDSMYLQHSSKPSWAGGLLRWFRALVDHPEDWSLIPTPTRQLTNICNYSSKKSNSLFWPLWVLHAHGTWT